MLPKLIRARAGKLGLYSNTQEVQRGNAFNQFPIFRGRSIGIMGSSRMLYSSSRVALFDRYQSLCQYHRPIDSPLYVWLNGNDGARPVTPNAVDKLGHNSYQTKGQSNDE
jgi:hypothetical protein